MNKEQLDILTNIIGGVESGGQIYGNRNYAAYAGKFQNSDKEFTCTLGWAQNYGNEAKKLCNMIFSADPVAFRNADSAGIESMLSRDWVAEGWNPNSAEKTALINIITTEVGKQCQDKLFQQLMETYIKHAEDNGVSAVPAQMMWCEIEHLGGLGPVKRVFAAAAQPYTPDTIFEALLLDQKDTSNNNQVGDKKFQSRHECCVKWIKQYVKESEMGTLQGLINRAYAEEGYIEKASNKDLDSKTSNKGDNNYTKYSRDINALGLMGCQAQPWCCTYQFWLEVQEFGLDVALKHWNMNKKTYVGYNCFSTYNAFAAAGKVGKEPKLGAVVIFTFSHAGRVVRIYEKNGKKYWDCAEGNTSSNLADRNGGQVKIKTREWNDSTVKGFCYIDYDNTEPEPQSEGWIKAADGKRWWWRNADGSYPANCWKLINHYWYLFDKDGYMLTGWQQWDSEKQTVGEGEWYYLDTTEGSTEGQCWHETKEYKGALEPWYVE